MNLYRLILTEMWRRPGPSITALLIVAAGVAALVSVESVATSSERKISQQLRQLGTNLLILPEGVSLQEYYAADGHGQSLPEEYVSRITMSQLVGVEELSPKLTIDSQLGDQPIVLTGVLPRTEFYKQSAWQSVDLLTADLQDSAVGRKHEGCTGRTCQLTTDEKMDINSYAETRIIHDLAMEDVLLGADVARKMNLTAEQKVLIHNAEFRVAGVLPATGTVDDGRVFAHLHRVQELSGLGPVVNVIEVVGCCEEAAGDLVKGLDELLPESRVVTISQIVEAQVNVNRVVGSMSYVVFGILMFIGGGSIASIMFSNVAERRRELGTLLALGATPQMVGRMILLKASTIGLLGSLGGLILGIIAAKIIGPQWLQLPVSVSSSSAAIGIGVATAIALLASYWPARQAALLDPCVCMRDL